MAAITEEMPAERELLQLYTDVGWTAYTADPSSLAEAVGHSTWVWAARDADGALVGLARVISDRTTIAYLQDILVTPDAQRTGVGGALLDSVLGRCAAIRQLVLMTDADPAQRKFYESRGLREIHDLQPHGLRAFVRLL